MTPELQGHLEDLVAAVLATVVLLVVVIVTGVKRKRSAHYGSILAMFAALGAAIFLARRLSPFMSYDEVGLVVKRVHFTFVGLTTLMVPFVAASGIKLAKALKLAERGEEGHEAVAQRAQHRLWAWWAVIVIVVTCALGTAMTVLGLPE